jgi:hypothetical protein
VNGVNVVEKRLLLLPDPDEVRDVQNGGIAMHERNHASCLSVLPYFQEQVGRGGKAEFASESEFEFAVAIEYERLSNQIVILVILPD